MLVTLDHDFATRFASPPEATAGIGVLECRGRLSPATIQDPCAKLPIIPRGDQRHTPDQRVQKAEMSVRSP